MQVLIKTKVTLVSLAHSIWREFSFSGETTIEEFCYYILAAFRMKKFREFRLEWNNCIYKRNKEGSTSDDDDKVIDPRKVKLKDLSIQKKDKLYLIYDFANKIKFQIKIISVRNRIREIKGLTNSLLNGKGKGILEEVEMVSLKDMVDYTTKSNEPAPIYSLVLQRNTGRFWDYREFNIIKCRRNLEERVAKIKETYDKIFSATDVSYLFNKEGYLEDENYNTDDDTIDEEDIEAIENSDK